MRRRHSCLRREPLATPSRVPLLVVMLSSLAGTSGAAADTAPALAPAPIALPQVRIDSLDTSRWPAVRVFATILDARGHPADVKALQSVAVREARRKSAPPLISFKNGVALDGRKDGRLRPAAKAAVAHSAVVLVSAHQHESLRKGSLGRRLKEAVGSTLKQFGKADRGQVLWVSDRIRAWWDLKGRTTLLSDVEETRRDCENARAEALSGLRPSLSGKAQAPPVGTDVCGLRDDIKDIGAALDSAAFEGFFPRPFGLGAPPYDHRRYCKPPREALASYGPISPENAQLQLEKRKEARLRGELLDYETSGIEEALRLLLRDGRPHEHKALLLLSDGHDGYLRDFDLCRESPPADCAQLAGHARATCVQAFLGRRAVAEQAAFRDEATHWLGVARAAGVRIYAVGIGPLGTRWELDRLRLLAERTGGTYREAETEADLAGATARMAAEVFGQVVIEFTHPTPELVQGTIAVDLVATLDPTKAAVGNSDLLVSRPAERPVPEPQTWRERATEAVEEGAAAAQELLGYRVFVVLLAVAAVLVGVVVLLVLFVVVRGMWRLARRLLGRTAT